MLVGQVSLQNDVRFRRYIQVSLQNDVRFRRYIQKVTLSLQINTHLDIDTSFDMKVVTQLSKLI